MAKNTGKTAPASGKSGSGDKKSFFKRFLAKCVDILRRFVVMLKRRPSFIPLAVFVVAFLVYSFHLTDVSNTTARLGGPNMGLAGFATMLLSMLSLLCFLNAFPRRKKPNVPMLVLMLVMVAIIIFCDYYYIGKIWEMVEASQGSIDPYDEKTSFIAYADFYLRQHVILLLVGVVLTALMPVYTKLLRKINTNVDVAGNGEMQAIDIAND